MSLLTSFELLAGTQSAASGGGSTPYVYANNEARTLVLAMATEPDSTRKGLIDALIGGLKADGIWSGLDILYVLAAHASDAAVLNWMAPANFAAIPVNSPDFAVDRGYTGNGTSSRLRTQFTPNIHATRMTITNASAWVWCLTNVDGNESDLGNNSGSQIRIKARTGNTQIQGVMNDGSNDILYTSTGTPTSVGFTGIQRTTTDHKRVFRNGVQMGTDFARPSTGLPSAEQWICGANPSQWSTKQIAVAAWGDSLTDKEAPFHTRIAAFLAAIGAA